MTKRSYICLFTALLVLKILISLVIYFYTGNQFFGGGNDSEYYHSYAIGIDDHAVNIWPVILRWLNDYLYYDRGFITLILSVLGILVIPLLVGKLIMPHQKTYHDRKDFWIIAFIVALYPSLYYQTTDMYRDVMMLFGFILFLFCCKSISEKRSVLSYLIALILTYVLFKFRPYLGGACFLTLLLSPFYSFKRYPLIPSLISYLLLLTILYHLNYLDRITDSYRGIFDNMEGGSNLGLRFTDTTTFIPIFLKSWLYQIGGVFFVNLPSIFVFLVESIPFLLGFSYIMFNRKYSNSFINCLIIFFISYNTVWLLGNDNLGSATRLRMFSYLVILITVFIIRQNKRTIIASTSEK